MSEASLLSLLYSNRRIFVDTARSTGDNVGKRSRMNNFQEEVGKKAKSQAFLSFFFSL